MNKLIKIVILGLATAIVTFAQTNPPTFIKGNLDIRYNSRTQPGKMNVTDDYKLNLNICNSAVFNGTVRHLPFVSGGTFSANQVGNMTFNVNCDVINPKNPAQTKNVGNLYGGFPIDQNNVYRFSEGNLRLGVVGTGNAQGFESKFDGTALGKPVSKPANWFESMKKEVLSITKVNNGKVVSIKVSKYDKMTFQSLKMPSGPVGIYPEVITNGELIYDYQRNFWFFNNLTMTYYSNGQQRTDKIGGNVRWIEHPQRAQNGQGTYEFEIKFNEKPLSELEVFTAATDEASFFEVDNSVPALLGSMKYRDVQNGGVVVSSAVTVDLTGNQISKIQAMNIFKLIFFVCLGPFNSE